MTKHTTPHLANQTKFTREGVRDMTNRKPFRTQRQKALAREHAKRGEDGAWRVPASIYCKITS